MKLSAKDWIENEDSDCRDERIERLGKKFGDAL